MYDGVVGHDCMVPLHQVQLAAAVLSRFVKTVDWAALRAGADGHAGDGLITADTINCSRPTSAWLQFLQMEWKEYKDSRGEEQSQRGKRRKEETKRTKTHMHTNQCMLVIFCTNWNSVKGANVCWGSNGSQILIRKPLLCLVFNMQISTHLFSILDFCCGSIVRFLKQDLLHLSVLQVVQLSYSILCPLYEIHQYGVWTFTLQKRMLELSGTESTITKMWQQTTC